MLHFLLKPRAKNIAHRYIRTIAEEKDYFWIRFHGLDDGLAWPTVYPLSDLFQVVAETFDRSDWHRYTCWCTPVCDDDIVVDIGAAEGLFALSVVRRCRRVFVIEPNPVFMLSLQQTYRTFPKDKVVLIPCAVGKEEGNVELCSHSISSAVQPSRLGSVAMRSLDHIFPEPERVTFIKADLEGYEMDMLQSARNLIRRCRPKMAIACYHQANNAEDMARFVTSLVPQYRYFIKGITQFDGKPVMIHFWISEREMCKKA